MVDSLPLLARLKSPAWLQHRFCCAKDAALKTSHEKQKAQKAGDDFEVVPGDPHERRGSPGMLPELADCCPTLLRPQTVAL
jgi:hypothetical protein